MGSVLLREGFRLILQEEHRKDLSDLIRNYQVLVSIAFYHEEWITNSLKFTLLGVKDPLVFLCQCFDKMVVMEKMKLQQSKANKIKNQYGMLDGETEKEINTITFLEKKQ